MGGYAEGGGFRDGEKSECVLGSILFIVTVCVKCIEHNDCNALLK